MATRLGVDVGGTFTDLIFYDDETGEVRLGKEPTTPAAPEEGVLAAIAATVPDDRLPVAKYFLHGTTVGLNSLLTRTGAVVGLLCTRGFRDVLEMARGDRAEPYNLFWRQSEPLVPRRRRLPVTERILFDGTVSTAFEPDGVHEALAVFREEGVTSVAVAFLNAYANPAHELAAAQALRDAGWNGEISLSHQVSGEYREYERTCTTVIDAYVRPRMTTYLRALEGRLRDAGFAGTAIVTRSGGGAMTFEEAEGRPFETIMSGPVAGAEGAGELARSLGLGDVITADVGGTSFDTCLVTGGRAQLMYEGEVEGLPVQSPWVDVRSIGAGGGSIAYVDVGGLLRVGPASAGAVPGPACYGRGGTSPTVTDAALVLGMLGHGVLASGLVLDRAKAEEALAPLAERLGFTAEQTARGIMTIAAANMAGAIREITIERGQDPRRARLMPFGGAGPLFGTLLAGELDVEEIVVPPYAGNFSAWGLLGSDLTQTAARTRITRLSDEALPVLDGVLEELFAVIDARSAGREVTREIAFDMRFVGQEHTLTIPVAGEGSIAATAAEIEVRFREDYERTFDHLLDETPEIVSVRATARTALARRGGERLATPDVVHAEEGRIDAWSFARGERIPFRILDRAAVDEEGVEGPAILLEETATTYVDAGYRARRGQGGVLVLNNAKGA
ncbi:MAG: hydantoinase/oxoprolinase family protein [Actinobacteria bacterium]|nr:hydantoinase/oxoprolinase family protein [Actinomycetota bacterium]